MKAKRQRIASKRVGEPVLVSAAPKNSLMYNNAYIPKPKTIERKEEIKAKKFDNVWEQMKAELAEMNK
jgi:hypothetical protein